MNIYGFFKFYSVGGISKFGTLQEIMGIAFSLYMLTELAEEEVNISQQLSYSTALGPN